MEKSGIRLFRLTSTMHCLCVDGMEAGEEVQILLNLSLPLTKREQGVRLVFPLAGEGMAEDCRVDLRLYTQQAMTKCSSPSHEITAQKDGEETAILAQFAANRDFILDMEPSARVSRGVVREGEEDRIGLYRLYSSDPNRYLGEEKGRVLLLLAAGGIRDLSAQRMCKELCYRIAKALPEGKPLQVITAGNPQRPLFHEFLPAGEETAEALLHALADCSIEGGVWELLTSLPEEEDTLIVMISHGEPEGMGRLLQGGKRMPRMHLCTVGGSVCTPLAQVWKRMEYGLHTHFYPEDVTEETAKRTVWRLLHSGPPVQVTTADVAAREVLLLSDCMATDGYLDLAVRVTGRVPACFVLQQAGVHKESIAVEQIGYYEHLPVAEQLYAGEKIQRLELLTEHTDAGTILAIKKQIEELSLRYGVLSSQTMLQIADEAGRKQGIPVQLGIGQTNIAMRRTIFGERKGYAPEGETEPIRESFMGILRRCIHSNGAIYDWDAETQKERAEQTAWAILALLQAKEKDRAWLPVILAGEAYLKTRTLTGPVGWLYEKRNRLTEYQKEVSEYLTGAYDEKQGVIAASQGLLRITFSFLE